ncbi:error-prone DNA polymerase [Pararhizobium sp.]|uniref:error-prone DNA polymerase n=1 Tax=Pararhizobium sp. TaxID=1977563 RepID=UPI00271B18D3|nr:error-prone DNA polymerase [Pararhizobium sp.]MDO9416870.1 error-prone DNA polymerase [Pararhizobium sp.]
MSRPPENPPIPFKIPAAVKPKNPPQPAPPYVELQCTSNFSFLRGASHPGELVLQARALGHPGIGIADRNTLAGVVRAHRGVREMFEKEERERQKAREARKKQAGEQGLPTDDAEEPLPLFQLLVGARLETMDGFSCLCYPRDRAAYGRLCRLLTRGKIAADKGECHIGFDDILEHAEGQLFIALPPDTIAGDALQAFEEKVLRLRAVTGKDLWLAIKHLYQGDDRARCFQLAALARRLSIALIATNDVHYHHPDRRPLQDVVTCIREKCTIPEAGFRLAANAERHLKPAWEMARLFADFPDAIANVARFRARCSFNLLELAYNYPNEPVPPGKTAQEHLEYLAWSKGDAFYKGRMPDKIRASLVRELAIIKQLNYAQYFLTVHDIVAFAKGEGILCQGRGSAANSTVCFCLGVTAVDPMDSQLLFERFLSADRKEPPDIDIDFEHERREEVIQHIYKRYGRKRAALAATVISYRPRSAVREVGKVMGLSEDVTSALANTVWGSWGDEIPESQVKQIGLDLEDPHLKRTLDLTKELLGFPRHLSQHVGGFVLTQDLLEELVPIGNAAMEERTFIEWDKDDIDELKIMKVDILALGMLTCIAKCFVMIKQHYGLEWDLATIKAGDEATYDMLCRADAIGVFQVESRAQMNMLPRLKPREYYDLVIEVAIVRPGPIQGDMVHPYLRRRDKLEQVFYPSPAKEHGEPDELKNILKRTLGVPLFQEQAMQIAIDAAKFDGKQANQLRRAMATFRNVGTIGTLEDEMVSRMIARGYDPDFSKRCFDQIKGFGEYGFPESHAASFAILVYASAWIKCHFPDVFCAALLNSQPMGFYAPAQIVRDAREHDIEVRPADVNFSFWDNTLEENHDGSHAVRLGLRQIDGLSKADFTRKDDKEPKRFLELRADHGGFCTLEELRRCTKLPLSVLERLASADALRSLGLDRRQGLWAVRGLMSDHQMPLFDLAGADPSGPDADVVLPAMRLSEHVVADYQTHRMSLKAHPVSFLRERYRQMRILSSKELFSMRHNQQASVAGVVLVRQRPGTAKGVVFMTLEDETGIVNIVVWKKVLQQFRKVVMRSRLVQVKGVVQRKDDIIHIVARELIDLTGDLDLLSDDTLPESLARGDEIARPAPENAHLRPRGKGQASAVQNPADPPALRHRHPRDVRIIPKSRDFH